MRFMKDSAKWFCGGIINNGQCQLSNTKMEEILQDIKYFKLNIKLDYIAWYTKEKKRSEVQNFICITRRWISDKNIRKYI